MIANHTPSFIAVERPDRKHLLHTLVIMSQHRIRNVRIHLLLNQVKPRVQSPIRIPKGKHRIVREAFRLFYVLVQATELSVRILKDKRMQGCMIGGSIKRFLCLSVSSQRIFSEFLFPECFPFRLQLVESQSVEFLHIIPGAICADCRNCSFHNHFFSCLRIKRETSHQILSPGFVRAAEPGSIINHRLLVLHKAQPGQFL